jgi:uncharacterized membrane protein
MAARTELPPENRDREIRRASHAPASNARRDREIAATGKRRGATIALGVLIALSIPIGLYAFGFQFAGLGAPDFYARFSATPLMAAFHVLGGGSALLLGGAQFSTRLRTRAPRLHRWSGRVYLTLVLIGGIGGAVLATHAAGGFVARTGFMLLALLWLMSGALAYRAIRAGNVAEHRRWMTRNFAMTFAAVTLRIWLPLLVGVVGLPWLEAYSTVAWLAWVPNLLVAEWLVLRRQPGLT